MADNNKPINTTFSVVDDTFTAPRFSNVQPVNPFGAERLYSGVGQQAWNPGNFIDVAKITEGRDAYDQKVADSVQLDVGSGSLIPTDFNNDVGNSAEAPSGALKSFYQDSAWKIWKATGKWPAWAPGGFIAKTLHDWAANKLSTDYQGFDWETGGIKQVQQNLPSGSTEQLAQAVSQLPAYSAPALPEEDNSDPWTSSYSETQNQANQEALGGWGADFINQGGSVNSLIYRQVGGPVIEEPPLPTPEDLALAGGQPPMGPMDAPMDPMAAPQQPMMPQPAPRMTFAERVEEARKVMQNRGASVPVNPKVGNAIAMDGQGDSVDLIDPAGAFQPDMSAQGLGPDMPYGNPQGEMLGSDDIDGHLPEGSMVMNPEASEMFAEELEMMARGGRV